MRITTEEVAEIWSKYSEQPEKTISVLKTYFSYEENIDVFSQFFFPESVCGVVPEFHKELYKELFKSGNNAFAAPRGHAKSTITGIIFIIYNVVFQREKYIVYVSQNHAKTVQFITPLRWEFKTNKLLSLFFGDLSPRNTRDDNEKDREDCIDIQGIRIEAVSFEKNLRGFKYKNSRPTLIIGDDIESDERMANQLLRQKDRDKMNKVIIPSLDIDGRLKMIGTVLHLNSLLMVKIKQYNGKIYQAIDDDGKILWPERFTKEKLDSFRKDMGSIAFQQEYLNNPVDNTTSLIKSTWIRDCYDEHYKWDYEDMDELYLGVDFAFSDTVAADHSAFVEIGVRYNEMGVPQYHLLHVRYEKGLSIREQMDIVEIMNATKNYELIAFEENSIKGYSKDVSDLGLPIQLYWMGSRDERDKKKPGYMTENNSKTISKTNAVNRLAISFENGQWVIPYHMEFYKTQAERLLGELTSWALEDGKLVEMGQHPDAPIGMILVMELMNEQKYVVI